MKRFLILMTGLFPFKSLHAQSKSNKLFKGMYLQWGYNTETFTHSNIHFTMSNGNDFILHHANAHDKGDYSAILKEPGQISIPQYSYRVGLYLNDKFTKSVELNFDHAKYVVTDGQTVRVTGTIDGMKVQGDSVLNPETFLHFEHTDGANWLHINYAEQKILLMNADKSRRMLSLIYKAGAGINIPRTDFTWRGSRFNNQFHIAGYNISAEGGLRFYFIKNLFLEGTAKTGYVRYINALANTNELKGNKATHGFGYLEGIATIGYDIKF